MTLILSITFISCEKCETGYIYVNVEFPQTPDNAIIEFEDGPVLNQSGTVKFIDVPIGMYVVKYTIFCSTWNSKQTRTCYVHPCEITVINIILKY